MRPQGVAGCVVEVGDKLLLFSNVLRVAVWAVGWSRLPPRNDVGPSAAVQP
jgi:hypothetical protein